MRILENALVPVEPERFFVCGELEILSRGRSDGSACLNHEINRETRVTGK